MFISKSPFCLFFGTAAGHVPGQGKPMWLPAGKHWGVFAEPVGMKCPVILPTKTIKAKRWWGVFKPKIHGRKPKLYGLLKARAPDLRGGSKPSYSWLSQSQVLIWVRAISLRR